MTSGAQSSLVEAWIKLQQSPEQSDEYRANFWAHKKMWALGQEAPQECWETILAILEQDNSDWILENLAAGPLEDLLVKHGHILIDQIESIARRNPLFRKLLSGVWQNEIPEEIWNRIANAATSSN